MGAGVMLICVVVMKFASKYGVAHVLIFKRAQVHTNTCRKFVFHASFHFNRVCSSLGSYVRNIGLQAALDASGKGGKGGGKGDRAQGISQGVDTIDKAMEAVRGYAF